MPGIILGILILGYALFVVRRKIQKLKKGEFCCGCNSKDCSKKNSCH